MSFSPILCQAVTGPDRIDAARPTPCDAGGSRRAGATILTTPGNADFIGDLVSGVDAVVEVVAGRRTLGRGAGSVVLHALDGRPHVDEMIVPWLPASRVLYQADLFWIDAPQPPRLEEAGALARMVDELGVEPAILASAHWGSGTLADLRAAVGTEPGGG